MDGITELPDSSGLVFPGMQPGRLLSENPYSKLLWVIGGNAVTQGF